jgi:hypothetical protein
MSEFCVKCSELESQLEIMRTKHYEQLEELRVILEKVKSENDALILDVAFYGGNLINLSCNNK